MSETGTPQGQRDDDTVQVARQVFADMLSSVEALPARVEEHQRQTMEVVKRAFRTHNEMTLDAVRAILEAIPATILRRAPQLDVATVKAIGDDIADHALARIKTLSAATALLNQTSDDQPTT